MEYTDLAILHEREYFAFCEDIFGVQLKKTNN